MESSVGSRLSLFSRAYGLDRKRVHRSQEAGLVFSRFWSRVIIPKNSRKYQIWVYIMLLWAIYSSFFTPFEFGFFRGLPKNLWWIDQVGQVMFMADIVVNFFVAYKDKQTYKWVLDHHSIAFRYAKSNFVPDVLGCLPWDAIYKGMGEREIVRYLLWVRLYRVRKVTSFFHNLEQDIRINYLFTRILKLITVEIYCTHTAACIFYYLATTLPSSQENLTWIGSLRLGGYEFNNFRKIDLGRRYVVSLYFAIVTMATVGYGDIHAVNTREMVFVMIFVSFDMILGAYLIGNMTALIVKGSNTEKFRDKMTALIKYLNRNGLGRDIRVQMKSHLQLQYECQFIEDDVVDDLPLSIRAKVTQSLYLSTVEQVLLFRNCSSEFINQIATRVHEEYFLPGEVVMEQGSAVDQIYIVASGMLEEVLINLDGSEETTAQLEPESLFGEIAVLCNIPQPFTVRVCDLCKVLRIDKQTFVNIMQIYFVDGRQVLNNLLKFKDSENRIKQLETDITFLIAEQEVELSLKVNNAAYHGKFSHLKNLVKAGADPKRADYDGRTPLHLAAARGHEDVVLFLIQEGANVNFEDNFGNTPLNEAVKGCHDRIAKILREAGGKLIEETAGEHLRKAVLSGKVDMVKHLLVNGINPNSVDHSGRTPLHIAASEGLTLMADILIKHGADIYAKDRWGKTPIDESTQFGARLFMSMFQDEKVEKQEYVIEGQAALCSENRTGVLHKVLSNNSPIVEEEEQCMETKLEETNCQLHSVTEFREVDLTLDWKTHHEGEYGARGRTALKCDENLSCGTVHKGTLEPTPDLYRKSDTRNIAPTEECKRKRCTVYSCPPWNTSEEGKYGLVLWVPQSIDTLLHMASQHFGRTYNLVLNQDAGEILSTDFIRDSEKVYMIDHR